MNPAIILNQPQRPARPLLVLIIYASYLGLGWVYRLALPALGVRLTDRLTGWVNVVISVLYLLLILYVRGRGANQESRPRSTWLRSILWVAGGFALIMAGQVGSAFVERAILGPSSSKADIASILHVVPLFGVAMVVIGPLIEEFVFREALFGLLQSRWGYWPGLLVSSLIFSAIHQELHGSLSRFVIGLILAFIYHRTNRLSVSWLAHALNNLLAMLAALALT